MTSIEARIIISARKAMTLGTDIGVKLPKYIDSISFSFLDGTILKSVVEWFSVCNPSLKEIKMSVPETVERHPFEGNDEVFDIICLWRTKAATRFVRNEQRNNGKLIIIYEEAVYEEDITKVLNVQDTTAEYMQTLSELMKFSSEIGYSVFDHWFKTAYKLLSGEISMDHTNVPDHLQGMSERLLNMIGAIQWSYVFGGMGMWNDDPRGQAEVIGLGNEYNRLTNALIYNMRRTLFYVTNTCWNTRQKEEK